MIKRNVIVLLVLVLNVFLYAKEPTTVISSDRMRMLRFKDHNEFSFEGNVQIKNTNFTGSCSRMWVFSVPSEHVHFLFVKSWVHGFNLVFEKIRTVCYLNFGQLSSDANAKFQQVGQIKIIIGWKQVQLETEDPISSEKKRSFSEKAVIYPGSGKMILSENPVVYSSTQGTFRGGKIIFYRASKHIHVENDEPGQRSQVFLGE